MTSVLVTGGAGYIGSHACKALARAGYLPVVYDDLRRGHDWAVRWGPLEQGDVLDRARLDAVIAQYKPAAVMHFAGYAYVNESVSDPGMYYRNNTVASLNLLEAMRGSSVRRIIFSSTCATYGDPETLPIKEDAPQRPINPYGASKLMTERMIADFASAHGLGWVALRYFNVAGADPDCEIGEAHDPEPHIIPLVLDAAAGARPHISIYGVDYPTPDGTCVRDYIHVSDLADAHVLALRSLEGGGRSGAYNLGNNAGYSIREVIASVERVTGLRVPVVEGPRRAGDPPALVGDGGRAVAALGWTPRFPALDDIVRTAWAWRQKGGAR